MNHTLDIKAVNKYKYRPSKDSREFKELDFGAEIIGTMNITEAEIGQEKGHFQEAIITIEIEVPVTVDQGQDLGLVLIVTE